MLLLLVDTAGASGGVLLARNDGASLNSAETRVLGECVLHPRQFSIEMIPALTELFRTNRLTLTDIDVFVAIAGPGSFTGLRVGLSAVKALAEVMAKPVVALSSLAVLASMTTDASGARDAELVHAILDAGRGEFYHGVYRDAGETRIAEALETRTTLTDSVERTPGVVVAWESKIMDALVGIGVQQVPAPTLRDALPLALTACRARRFCDVVSLDANYLRRVDVEIGQKVARHAASRTQSSGL